MQTSSWIRKMFEEGMELARFCSEENVFDFSLGNPITEPQKAFFDKLKELAENPIAGSHRYMPNQGLYSARSKIAAYYSKEFDMNITADEVIMTVGAAGAINVILKTFIDPANEVITFAPYFAEYKFYADNHQARLVVLGSDDEFNPDLERLRDMINPETAAIIINSPHNPTGKIYSEEFIKDLVEVLEEGTQRIGRPIYIISDEPYRKIVYDGYKNPVIFKYYKYSIFVTSHSKDLSLAGERIGYAIVHPDMPWKEKLMTSMAFSNRILGFVNAPAIMQLLVEDIVDESVDIKDYQEKRDLLYNGLIDAGFEVYKPQGAFYIFVKSPIKDELKMIEHLKRYHILAVPGVGFGKRGYFRLSYAVKKEVVERSIPLFKKAMEDLKYLK